MSHTKAFETKLNIIISTLFNEKLGIQSISETRCGRARPDILMFVGGLKMIIEGSYSRTDAENDVNVPLYVHMSRKECNLKYINGAAPVIYKPFVYRARSKIDL